MAESQPSIYQRVAIALNAFRRILIEPRFASTISTIGPDEGADRPQSAAPEPSPLRSAEPSSALQLLGMLQQDGRFIDFLQDDITAYSDAEVGAAARVVHTGCRETLERHFSMEPVRAESEGTRITLESGFDPGAIRLAGRVLGDPPFSGRLTHGGWRVTDMRLPQVASGHDLSILAPAEVEL